jgi:uncharacterized membrane protein YfcA
MMDYEELAFWRAGITNGLIFAASIFVGYYVNCPRRLFLRVLLPLLLLAVAIVLIRSGHSKESAIAVLSGEHLIGATVGAATRWFGQPRPPDFQD